jgi:hypothetical protein
MQARRERERERESDRERSEKEKEMFVCVQLATMPDHACVVERRFFANDSLLKCRRSSSSHGCFARLSMHRVFSTELSIALTDAEDFFKCIQAAVSWEIDRSIERERERERALSWKDSAASRTRMEATCCLLAASRIRMQKKSLVVFCSFLRLLLFKMRHESAGLQKSGNLEVDRKLTSTLQTQHQLRACTLAGSVAKNKVQAEARKKKQKNEEEESESEEAEARRRRRRRGVSSSQKQRWIHNVFDVILDQYCRPQCL